VAQVFARHRARGTLVISPLAGGGDWVHDAARARKRFSPASTFKVPNSLIALHPGVVDEKQVLRWDGKDRGRAEWSRDHTLESALRVSCVWCYQVLARRIGAARYRELLTRIGYGNARVGREVTTFWLDGSLQISALEQIAFLRATAGRPQRAWRAGSRS
jgi:beta-lactamase class D